ncbi:putative hydrophobic protein (TIGR00271 family) [Sphingomonas zeicaulis]|uniref:DUF389 domain-containing protein n=1 Tax=Sphingomonas zeicaulis TaxID=1632740 RepID=UPI003D1B8A46
MPEDQPEAFRANVLWRWWRARVIGSVDHVDVVAQVDEDARWTPRYLLMTLLAAGIAMLGLLLSSPAVVIGAMLLSPLMGPIIGFGFSLALFDFKAMRDSLQALALGAVIAVLFAALIVTFSPIQTVTAEIAARTRPNLFDLIVAILSAVAGAYAVIRERHGTIVGVAIATALMPPLATVGFGLATRNWTVFGGALLLFFTNLMAIALTASVMARFYGFGSALSPKQTRLQATLVIATLLALAVPLGLTLRQIGREAVAARQTRDAIAAQFVNAARIDDLEIQHGADAMRVSAVVFTPTYRKDAEAAAIEALRGRIDRPVELSLDQVIIGQGDVTAEQAQVQAARESQQAQERGAAELAAKLALVAGVDPATVTVDRQNRRALVRAAPLPDATLSTYRALESRVALGFSGWTIELVPPPLMRLPIIDFVDDKPNPAAIELVVWAERRNGLPVTITGSAERTALVVGALRDRGIDARAVEGDGGSGVLAGWAVP